MAIIKRFITLCFGFAVLGAGAVGAEVNVGFVNIPYVIEQSPKAKEASKRLERVFAPQQKTINDYRAELEAKREEISKNSLVMTEEQRTEAESEIRRMERQLKRDEQDFREELNIEKNNEFRLVRTSVLEAINALAKAEKYDLILSDGVLYSSKSVDLTEKVLEYMKK